MKSTKLLKFDHQLILQGLRVLKVMTKDIESGEDVSRYDIRRLLTFLRDFADGCHHVKEEAIFFPALMMAGISRDHGPLDVINHEHECGRALVSAMQDAIDRDHTKDFAIYASRYIEQLTQHMEKENWILFDLADQILNDEEDESIVDAFNGFLPLEDRMRRVIGELASKYPTDISAAQAPKEFKVVV